MKVIPLVLVVLLAAVAAEAQTETYSVGPASAANVVTLSTVIVGLNGDNCVRYSLPRTCTQAQVCTSAAAPGGASCTAAQARGSGVRIYPATFAGREEFMIFNIALPKFLELVAAQQQESRRAFCEGWAVSTVTARNSACSALGLPASTAGCDPGC